MYNFECISRQMTVQLNESCNLSCDYCMAPKETNTYMSIENIDFLKSFILHHQIDFLKITGGEPTLHPKFIDFINWLTKNRREYLFFSNLSVSIDFEKLINVPDNCRCSVLVNVSEKNRLTDIQHLIREKNIKILRDKGIEVNVSCTIFSEQFRQNLENALSCALNYGSKIVRISVANPRFDGSNVYLNVSKYCSVVNEVLEIIKKVRDIKFVWDCVMPPCLFTEDQYNKFLLHIESSRKCLPRLNVNYDLRLSHCYVVENYESCKTLRDFNDIEHLNHYITDQYEFISIKYKRFAECKDCRRKDKCCACFGLRGLVGGGYLGEFARRDPL